MVNPPVPTLRRLLPSAVTDAPVPMKAATNLLTMGTPTDAPTPAVGATPTDPVTSVSSSASLAAMAMLPLACTLPAPNDATDNEGSTPMKARVVRFITKIPAAPATPAEPPTAPAAAIETTLSEEFASTCIFPATLATAPEPIDACVVLVMLATLTPAPTPALPPIAMVPPTANRLVVSVAWTSTLGWFDDPFAGCACMLSPLPMVARVVSFSMLTAADAATPADSP